MVAGLIQLNRQICQLLGMGGIVTGHILHQRHQLFHGGMLTLRSTACAAAGTVMAVAMVVIVVMGMAMVMQMRMVMGMLVGMFVRMGMLVGMGDTVMGVLVGMFMGMLMGMAAHMVVMDMHIDSSLGFFLIIQKTCPTVNEKGEAPPLP